MADWIKMKKKTTAIFLTIILLTPLFQSSLSASAATEDEIQDSINQGLVWLTSQQNPDGSWGADPWQMTALTAFSLIKLQDRACELEYDSPFDPAYNYSENIVDGWGFIFATLNSTPLHVAAQNISIQTHGVSPDDPDTNGNGVGVYFHNPNTHYTCYTTGLTLMALEASGTPLRLNDGGLDTFKELAAGYAATVQENEPGTTTYQWYLAEDESKCLLHESFTDSEALLQHLANVGPSLPDLLAGAPITRVEVIGTPTDAAREALDGLGASYFPHFAGFQR